MPKNKTKPLTDTEGVLVEAAVSLTYVIKQAAPDLQVNIIVKTVADTFKGLGVQEIRELVDPDSISLRMAGKIVKAIAERDKHASSEETLNYNKSNHTGGSEFTPHSLWFADQAVINILQRRPYADAGKELFEARMQKYVFQKTVGAAVGVPQSTVSQWELGKTAASLERVERLERFFEKKLPRCRAAVSL
jgi:DNA-binding XRE family transcriptional regulator